MCRFSCELSFHFPGISAQECKCWVAWSLQVQFYEKQLPNSFPEWPSDTAFYSPLSLPGDWG